MKYKAIIFDLDQTLIDSSKVEHLRVKKQWHKVLESFELIEFNTKISNLLNILVTKGVKIGVITNSPGKYAGAILSHFGIPFHSLVGYHDVKKRKPNPEAFIKTLNTFQLTSNLAISFGDHDNDIIASKSANIYSVGVKWYTPSYDFKSTPDCTYTKIEEMELFLKLLYESRD